MKKIIIISILSATALLLITTPIRWSHLAQDFWISYVLYFVTTYFLYNRFPTYKKQILLSFLFTVIGLILLGWVMDGEPPTVGIPNILNMLFATISSYIFYTSKSKLLKGLLIITAAGISIFYVIAGIDYWLHYINFGNYTGQVTEKVPANWKLSDSKGNTVNYKTYGNKIVLLDFWNTGCVVCFARFPELQKLYDKYKNDNRVIINAVNIPWDRDTAGMAFKMVANKKYTFPVVLGRGKIDSVFKVFCYPTTIIIAKGNIVFRGHLSEAAQVIAALEAKD